MSQVDFLCRNINGSVQIVEQLPPHHRNGRRHVFVLKIAFFSTRLQGLNLLNSILDCIEGVAGGNQWLLVGHAEFVSQCAAELLYLVIFHLGLNHRALSPLFLLIVREFNARRLSLHLTVHDMVRKSHDCGECKFRPVKALKDGHFAFFGYGFNQKFSFWVVHWLIFCQLLLRLLAHPFSKLLAYECCGFFLTVLKPYFFYHSIVRRLLRIFNHILLAERLPSNWDYWRIFWLDCGG